MFVRYNQRAMYIPYAAYIIFSISLFIFKGKTDFSSIFWWYLLLSNVAMTYITFRKKFSRHSHGYCMTFFMLMLITLFSAECHCSGSMQMIFFIIVCINSLYNSIGINLFEIIYITLLYLSYLIFAQSDLMITAGSVGWLYIRFAMLYIGFALITLIIVLQKKIIRDAAERNEVARKATRVKSDFLANMSHEIRTPMNAVLGMVELALRCDMSEEAREYVRNIRSAGKNLLDIINDILDFSKIESGKMQIVEAEYEVMSLLNDVVNITHSPTAKSGVEFIVDADPDMPRLLFGDELRIKQAVLNFLSNAMKFTNSGSITIKMSYLKKDYGINLMVSIKDTGIGIKEKDMDKLFNSFQQLDTHKNRRVEGTGLGLCVSKQLIELMGGFINVKSVYNEGSEFSFVVPQNVIDKRPCVNIENIEEYNVVVCEEAAVVRQSLLKTLSDLKIKCFVCENIDEMLDYISGNEYTHIFIEYKSYKANKERLKNIDGSKIAALYNANEFTDHSENIRFLCKPVYHLSIAKILCGEYGSKRRGIFDETHQTKFTAPEAKILLVDDNVVNLRVAEGLLRPYNMKIQTVTSGVEAIKRVQEEKFDIVFMDHMMPEMDGVEATKTIRALGGEYYTNLTIIALTANAISGAKEFFIKEGMNDFISKPIEMRDMAAKLKRWLPDDKIVTLDLMNDISENTESNKAFAKEGADAFEELQDSAYEIKENDEVDFNKGIYNCGGNEEIYRSIAEVYVDDVDSKAELIRSYKDLGNIKDYVIEVHALKSASRSIGAEPLASLAESLEKAGKADNVSEINDKTDALIEEYFKVKQILSDFCKGSGSGSDNPNSLDKSEVTDSDGDSVSNSNENETKEGVLRGETEIALMNYDENNSDVEDSFLFSDLDDIILNSEISLNSDSETVKDEAYGVKSDEGTDGINSDIDFDINEYDAYLYDGGYEFNDETKPLTENISEKTEDNSKEEIKNFPADDAWGYEYAFTPFEELETLEEKGFAGKMEREIDDYEENCDTESETEKNILEEIDIESAYDDKELFGALNSIERMNENLSVEERFGFSVNDAETLNNIECKEFDFNNEASLETKIDGIDVDVSSDGIKRVIAEMRRAVKLEEDLCDKDKEGIDENESINIYHDGEKYVIPQGAGDKLKKIHDEILPSSTVSEIAKYRELCFKIKELKECIDCFNIPDAESKLFEIGAIDIVLYKYRSEFERLIRLMNNFDYNKVAVLCGKWIRIIERECSL